jgi:hypothetical protein
LAAHRTVSVVFAGRSAGAFGRPQASQPAATRMAIPRPIDSGVAGRNPALGLLASVSGSIVLLVTSEADGRVLAIADFSRDGVGDVAWLDEPDVVWLGNGDGTYRRALRSLVPHESSSDHRPHPARSLLPRPEHS